MKKCKKHPRYKGIRKPKDCHECLQYFVYKLLKRYFKNHPEQVEQNKAFKKRYPEGYDLSKFIEDEKNGRTPELMID